METGKNDIRIEEYTKSGLSKRKRGSSSPCLQCKPCGSGCKIVDNRVSFVFDLEKKCISRLQFNPEPLACLGRCGKSCQKDLIELIIKY